MLSSIDVSHIVGTITYKPGWSVVLGYDQRRPFIQLSVSVLAEASRDSSDPERFRCVPWKSGKRYLSRHMCRQEIVGAVFGLIKDAEEHEMREWFRYRGASIFNPHLDPDALVEVAKRKASFSMRENAMSMEEPPSPPLAQHNIPPEAADHA